MREKTIPKAGGKLRRLGIPTTADRVVQAALKLVLEPIFEADFKPCSYGFRPKRRAQDAIAEIHYLASPTRNYEWVFEADITACFDEIDHTALMGRVRRRVGDKRVLGLVKAFLRAGILTEEGRQPGDDHRHPPRRDPLTAAGQHRPVRAGRALRRKWEALGPEWTRASSAAAPAAPAMRLVRYADDFVVMVPGTRADAEALWDEVSAVLAPMGLRLSEEKTRVCHIDEGFDFLGWRIQRRRWRGRAGKRAIYTYPSKKALASVIDKVRSLTRRATHRTLADLLRRLNPVLRGWCNYFRHGVSARTFSYVDHFAFWRIVGWLRKRHVGLNMHTLVRRFLPGWEDPRRRDRDVPATSGRHRALPLPGHPHPHTHGERGNRITRTSGMNTWRAGCAGSRTSGSEGGPEKPTSRKAGRAPRSDPYTHFGRCRAAPNAFAIIDLVSRKWLATLLSAEETSTQVQVVFGDALEAEGWPSWWPLARTAASTWRSMTRPGRCCWRCPTTGLR